MKELDTYFFSSVEQMVHVIWSTCTLETPSISLIKMGHDFLLNSYSGAAVM